MKIVLVGAGKVATHLGIALQSIGYNIDQVYSRTELSAGKLASLLNCHYTTSISQVYTDATLYVIALSDSALSTIIPLLCKERKQGVFIHTAGSISKDIFKGNVEKYGVLYPLQTFSSDREVNFSIVPFFIEASDDDTFETLKKIALKLSPKVYKLTTDNRQYLHLAAVFACNFVNHCYDIAQELLKQSNLPFEVLLPLIDETAKKVHKMTPNKAQTGPAIRHDENVMNKHLALLHSQTSFFNIYREISQSIQNIQKK